MAETNQAAPPPFSAEGQPTLQQLVDYFVAQLTDPGTLERIETTIANAGAKAGAISEGAAGYVVEHVVKILAVPLARVIGGVLVGALNGGEPLYDELGKVAIDSLLGARGRPKSVPDDVGASILKRLAPVGGEVAPGIDGAQQYLTMLTHLNVESWALGVFTELFGEAAEILTHSGGALESVAELREMVIQIMGGGRITRRVLAPFIDAGIVAPAKWYTNKLYRPELLGNGAALEAWTRGDLTDEEVDEELGRQGWSARRIGLMRENARKRLTLSDLFFRHYRGELSDADVAQAARGIGYDPGTAQQLLAIDDAKRVDALHAPIISEAIANFVSGDIDDHALEQWVNGAAPNATDAARMISTAKDRRAIGVRRISSTRMRVLVLEGIANVEDYRRALARENYPVEDAVLEELSLRAELAKRKQPAKKDATLAQLELAVLDGSIDLGTLQASPAFRALSEEGQAIELAIVRAKIDKRDADAQAKADAAAAKAAKEAEIAEKRSRVYPALTEYRTAYVRGYIDRATYAAALTREKVVDDDAAFLLAGADADREKWLADQARAEQLRAAAEHRGLSIAEREQAVLADILGLSEFDASLAKDKLDDADRHILVQLLQAKLADRDAAKAKRDEAAAAAAAKGASIAEWEHAVLLGVRTMAQYAAFLATLPLTDAARALIVDSLEAQLDAADQAKATRAARDAKAQAQGISLAQRRRAVIAGVRPRTYYAAALDAAGWPVDDQLAELDLLDTEIAAAAAARDKRDQVDVKVAPSILSLSQLERALTLGLVSPTEFADAVTARGATAADVDLLLQLAIAKVPDARAAVQLHAQVATQLAEKGVAIADLDKAVLRGLVTVDAYGADLTNRGYGEDAVALLVQLIQDRLDVDVDGLRKKLEAALAKAADAPALAELEQQLADGTIDADAFQGALVDAGAARDAALVYARLVMSGEAV